MNLPLIIVMLSEYRTNLYTKYKGCSNTANGETLTENADGNTVLTIKFKSLIVM